MSSTHRKKIARALAATTGLAYQQALALVVEADENGTLPRPLDENGIRRAVDMLVAQTEDTESLTVEDPAEFAERDAERPAPRADLNAILREALEKPGLIIAAGPTGSGKSTVLYEAVRDRLRGSNRIVTIENPIEVRIHPEPDDQGEIVQRQMDHDHESFDGAFKYALRRDPDVLLIGEVRAQEHAAAVVRAADTGHLVLSAVHAKGPSAVVHRLIRLGVTPEDVAATLKVVVTTWQEGGQFYSTTWPVTDIIGSIIRHQHALPTFDAELRRAFGEEPAPESTTAPPVISRADRLARSERVLDVVKTGPSERPSIGHVLVTASAGNLLLTGRSGAGKSVIARQAAAIHSARGDRVIVIDIEKHGADYQGLPVEVIVDRALAKGLLAAYGPENPHGDQRTLLVVEDVRALLADDDAVTTSVHLRSIMAASESTGVRVVATSQDGVFAPPTSLFLDPDGVGENYPLLARDFDTRVLLGEAAEDSGPRVRTFVDTSRSGAALAQGWAFVESDRCPTEAVNLWGKEQNKTMHSSEKGRIKAGLRQIAVMLHVGVMPYETFEQAAASAGSGEAAAVFGRIHDGLVECQQTGEGHLAISRLMGAEPHAFASWVVKTVETAERDWQVAGRSDTLPAALERIAEVI